MNWRPNLRAEAEYSKVVWGAFSRFVQEAHRRGVPVVELSGTDFLEAYARQAAARMVTMLWANNARTWREAAAQGGKSALLYSGLKEELSGKTGERVRELVAENAKLISTFPSNVAALVAARAAAQHLGGGRSSELARLEPFLQRVARRRSKLIARTEVSKASTALIEARSEALNLPWYIWRTSKDERVRPSHRLMNGVLIRFDTPPAPEMLLGINSKLGRYNAGNCPNDRCYPEPVVTLKQIRFPAKVYWASRIQYMNRNQFLSVSQFEQEAA